MENKIKFINAVNNSDAVIVGAGAGLSAAAGLLYSGKRFSDNFAEYIQKYGFADMYSAGFYPFKTQEEKWGYWSKHIYHNRYEPQQNEVYSNLYRLVADKDYFVITTNVDHLFQKHGFEKQRLFYTQGDYGLWQCSVPCHHKTYDNEQQVMAMLQQQADTKIPSDIIPHCPRCGAVMSNNLRADNTFVQDSGWDAAMQRYEEFIRAHTGQKVLFLELGIGANTPSIIKYPFWQMTYQNKNACYCCINLNDAFCPPEIAERSICINTDIAAFFATLY